MKGPLRDALRVACALTALTLASAAARADVRPDEHCTREDAQSAAAPEADGIAAEAVHRLPEVTVESHALPATPRRGFWPALFVDHFDLATKLRAIKRLKIVPVFDNARVTIFLGVDRHGVAGLHIQQQDANDLPPLLARNAPLADPPPLRAVPLRLP